MLNDDKNLMVVVNGYADKKGSASSNMKLSMNRANTVKRYLIAMGISADRIKVVAHGDKDPLASNDSVEGRSLNRCAVLQLTEGTIF
jgi:OOP family OmpA-OmpF porin